jgi:hypothetical protein
MPSDQLVISLRLFGRAGPADVLISSLAFRSDFTYVHLSDHLTYL